MRVLAMLILFGFLGCMSEAPTTIQPVIQAKWEAPTLYVRLPEDVSANDYQIDIIKALCKEFAIRLYDAFDGQVYISHFVICNPSVAREKEPGMINLFEPSKILVQHSVTYMGSPPLRPGYSYVMMPMTMDGVKTAAATMIHEWLHSYIGLGDEYRHATDQGGTRTTSCPLSPYSSKSIDEHACIMCDAERRELCRLSNHNPNTDQGKEPCYEFAARVLAESRLAYIKVPNHRIVGPFDPPTPIIEVRLK